MSREDLPWYRRWWLNSKDNWYYLKCFVWHRYNRIHIRTLPPTWQDRCNILPHVMFQVLSDFIEKEKPYDWFDTADSPNAKEWIELREIYDWWKNYGKSFDSMHDYDTIKHTPITDKPVPGAKDLFELICDRTPEEDEYWKTVFQREEDFEKELTEKMKRLCELRGMLWT